MHSRLEESGFLMRLMVWQGGYRAWINAGLPTKDSADYAASPVDVISERLSGVTTAASGSL